jgi:hypothetical protein
MIGEWSIGGVFVPTLLAITVLSFGVSLFIRVLFRRIRLYRFVWHAGLFDVAVFVVITWLFSLGFALEPYGLP